MDISSNMLPDPDGCQATYLEGSAIDFPHPFSAESFDFVVLGDVLHHLVGSTRAESKRLAHLTLLEATHLLKPGGHLILKDVYFESSVGPHTLTSNVIFYGLKYGGRLAPLLDDDAAEGLLVSFYTSTELVSMLERVGLEICGSGGYVRTEPTRLRRLLTGESGCIRLYAQKPAPAEASDDESGECGQDVPTTRVSFDDRTAPVSDR